MFILKRSQPCHRTTQCEYPVWDTRPGCIATGSGEHWLPTLKEVEEKVRKQLIKNNISGTFF